jgi:hypothetical protein
MLSINIFNDWTAFSPLFLFWRGEKLCKGFMICRESFKNTGTLIKKMMKKGKYNLTKYILDVMGFGLVIGSALITRLAKNDYVLIIAGVLVSIEVRRGRGFKCNYLSI